MTTCATWNSRHTLDGIHVGGVSIALGILGTPNAETTRIIVSNTFAAAMHSLIVSHGRHEGLGHLDLMSQRDSLIMFGENSGLWSFLPSCGCSDSTKTVVRRTRGHTPITRTFALRVQTVRHEGQTPPPIKNTSATFRSWVASGPNPLDMLQTQAIQVSGVFGR